MKNKNGLKTILASFVAILCGLLIGLVIMYIAKPTQFADAFGTLIQGSLYRGTKSLAKMFDMAVPIMMTGLSVAFAFKCGLFNIGTPGQYLVGAFTALFIALRCTFIPQPLVWVVALLGAGIAGALWASVPGMLKAYKNVNVVISCIMMNYIGLQLVIQGVKSTIYNAAGAESYSAPDFASGPSFGLDKIFNQNDMNGGILIAILLCVLAYIIMNKTTFGFELRACGFNAQAAKYAGMNEKKSIILSMAVAGFFAGIGGGLTYLAGTGNTIGIAEILPAEGFNGIPVALLGANNPIGVIIAAIFIAHINVGGFYMQGSGIAVEIIDIIVSVIIYFSSFSLFIKLMMDNFTKRKKGGQS